MASCSSSKKTQQALLTDKSYCHKQITRPYTKAELPKPIHLLQIDTLVANRFSKQSVHIANAIGVLDILTEYTRMSKPSDTINTIEMRLKHIELWEQIHQKINLASLSISAIASELDCEEERANQFANFLEEEEGKTERKLIISSIVIGALGAIAGEIIANNSHNTNFISGFSIGVSVTEATLGAAMLFNNREIEFIHNENVLKDIWNNTEVSNYFPKSIWYYLTYENPNQNEKSLAKLLVDKWRIFGQVADNKNNAPATTDSLYFGNGGIYNTSALKNRANMLDQTESYITLMNQDLRILTYEIEKLHFR